jgi:rhodanese-related sulfurtransferase
MKMKKLNRIMFLMLILPFLLVTSCKDDDPVPVNPIEPSASFDILSEYLVESDMDLPDVLGAVGGSWIAARPATMGEIDGFLASRYVIDIRGAEDYNLGHIEGAVNSSLGSIVADAENAEGKQILVVCYTGQTASHATVALRLSGFGNAQVLKWGMSGWTTVGANDHWSGATSSAGKESPNWTMDATAPVETFTNPTFTTTSTDGATILEERVAVMTAGGFKGVASTDVYGNPANYHINNYWAQADVDKYGHIDGAYRINPLSLAGSEMNSLDPDVPVITYCWTGQTSSMITAYLTVLGYDAKSLKFGANSMIYEDLVTNKAHNWSPPASDYPLVTN